MDHAIMKANRSESFKWKIISLIFLFAFITQGWFIGRCLVMIKDLASEVNELDQRLYNLEKGKHSRLSP